MHEGEYMTSATAGSDKLRYTVILSRSAHERLTALTEQHKLSQAEVIEALLLQSEPDIWDRRFEVLHQAKDQDRANKRALISKLSKLTPEQLAKLGAI